MPCGDKEDCHEKAKLELTADDHSDHEHESEQCSPFCICSCCGTYSQISSIYELEVKINNTISDRALPYVTDHISEISLSIWQPPKLG